MENMRITWPPCTMPETSRINQTESTLICLTPWIKYLQICRCKPHYLAAWHVTTESTSWSSTPDLKNIRSYHIHGNLRKWQNQYFLYLHLWIVLGLTLQVLTHRHMLLLTGGITDTRSYPRCEKVNPSFSLQISLAGTMFQSEINSSLYSFFFQA